MANGDTDTTQSAQPAPEGFLHSLASSLGIDPEAVKDTARAIMSNPHTALREISGEAADQLEDAATHPLDTIKQTAQGVVDQITNPEAQKVAKQRWAKPGLMNKVAGAEEYLTSGVPLVGGNIAKAEEQGAQGNVRGSLGTMAGTVGPALLEVGAKAAPEAFHEAAATARENMAARSAARLDEARTGKVITVKPGLAPELPAAPEEPAPHITFDSIGGKEVQAPAKPSTSYLSRVRDSLLGPPAWYKEGADVAQRFNDWINAPFDEDMTNKPPTGEEFPFEREGATKTGEQPPEPVYEKTLAERGQLPGQTVNLSDAYGSTGGYVGGHIQYRVPKEEQLARAIANMQATHGPELQEIPEELLGTGDAHSVGTHELAHAVRAAQVGLPTAGAETQSYLHPNTGLRTAAEMVMDWSQIPGVERDMRGELMFPRDVLERTFPQFLSTLIAGGVGEELGHGIPFAENLGTAGDIETIHRVGKILGFSKEQVQDMIDAELPKTRAALQPVINHIKEAASTREEGLSPTLLHSKEKVQDLIRKTQEVPYAENEGEHQAVGEQAGGVVPAAEPSRPGIGAENNVREGDGKAVPAAKVSVPGALARKVHDVVGKLAEKFGLSEDASGIKNGGSYITPEGKFIHLPAGIQHEEAVRSVAPDYMSQHAEAADARVPIINDTKMARVRYSEGRQGKIVAISVPKSGVTEEQMPAIQQAIAQAGRNGNVRIERVDVSPETKDQLTMTREFPRAADAEDYLRQIQAHPEQQQTPAPAQPKSIPAGSKFVPMTPEDYRAELDKSPRVAEFPSDTAEGMRNHRIFKLQAPDGKDTGIAYSIAPNKEMVGLVNNGSYTGATPLAVKHAFAQGATHTQYAWDLKGKLADFYKGLGVGTVVSSPYNREMFGDRSEGMKAAWRKAGWKDTDPYPNYTQYVAKEGFQPTAWENIRDWHKNAAAMAEKQGGGFTIDPRTGRVPTDGFMVNVGLEQNQHLAHEGNATPDEIRQFYEINKDLFAQHPNLYVGGYKNDLELSAKVDDRATAEALAKKLNQISIWDNTKGEEIPTGGTGKTDSMPEYPLDLRMADSRGEAPRGSSVPLMKNPLVFAPSGDSGPLVFDLQKALHKALKSEGGISKKDDVQMNQALQAARHEIAYQMQDEGGALGWYDRKTADAIQQMSELHPELLDAKDGPAKQTLFKAMWTAMSYGNDPVPNMDQAEAAFDQYEKTGQIPLDRAHLGELNPFGAPMKWSGYGGNVFTLRKTQWLIDNLGEQGAADFLTTKHTLPEIHEAFKGSGLSINLPKVKGEPVYGARVFGPKGGPFFENLNGIHENTVTDVWGARMLRRWLGTLPEHSTMDHETGMMQDDVPSRTEIQQFHHITSTIGQELKLDIGDTQALFWYYEHELYRVHGVGEKANDYAAAAREVVNKRRGVQSAGDEGAGRENEEGRQAPVAEEVHGSPASSDEGHELSTEEGDTSFDFGANEPEK